MKQTKNFSKTDRKGVVAILFAILLPVLLLLAMIAINIAHMQLTRTELKIATDASARAGGRAWSEFNDIDQAKIFAQQAAGLNTVSGRSVELSTNEAAGQMVFGDSLRDGTGRFGFSPVSEVDLANGDLASGFQVNASHDTPLLFSINGTNSFQPSASSIATQIERDIALIVDRSVSMFFFEGQITNPGQGEDFLFTTMTDLYEDPANGITREEWLKSIAEYQGLQEAADMRSSDREYTDNIINLLTGDLKTYAETLNSDHRNSLGAPRFSRWHGLEIAYEAFFDVLDTTEQDEMVSVVSFATEARLDIPLTFDLESARPFATSITPKGSTAIGDGMLQGVDSLNASNARLGAIKTLIVMSDGLNRAGVEPVDAANQIVAASPNVVINTVTFGTGADIDGMEQVASIGSGKHFHADTSAQLVEIFEELAASHRTLITD